MTLRLLSIPATLLHIQHPAYYLLLASLFPGTTFSHTDRGRFAISTDCFRQSRLVHTHLFSDGILDLNLLEPLKLTPEIIDAMEPPIVPDVQSEPDRIPTTKRYWKESNGQLCSICLESDHQARNCSHQLCLTCGAIDEHITRQCPVSLVCHSCGSRGHLSRHCPSSSRVAGSRCARCDSTIHLTLNCPSIWRAYDEESNDRPKRVLRACYYCGDTGDHFGDECHFEDRVYILSLLHFRIGQSPNEIVIRPDISNPIGLEGIPARVIGTLTGIATEGGMTTIGHMTLHQVTRSTTIDPVELTKLPTRDGPKPMKKRIGFPEEIRERTIRNPVLPLDLLAVLLDRRAFPLTRLALLVDRVDLNPSPVESVDPTREVTSNDPSDLAAHDPPRRLREPGDLSELMLLRFKTAQMNIKNFPMVR
ncbi:hypothetical protein H4Q26_005516 [Puccinia striiformis f. sp. tritici PST-130]|nr:hypothetical protein H4Q26_005516 [Puccinia striiformis f. sp. tritici PST-130]